MNRSNVNTNCKKKILIYHQALSSDAAIAGMPDLKNHLMSTLAISDPLILIPLSGPGHKVVKLKSECVFWLEPEAECCTMGTPI